MHRTTLRWRQRRKIAKAAYTCLEFSSFFRRIGGMPRAKQLTVWVPDQPGTLGEIASALGEKKTNIGALMGATEGGRGAVRLIVDKPATAKKVFAARGWQTTEEEGLAVPAPGIPRPGGRHAARRERGRGHG